MQLVNMKMSPEEAKEDYGIASPSAANLPAFPYGLELSLNDEVLAKLGMTLPAVGAEFTLMAIVKVTSASSNETEGAEPEIRASMQITDMQLTPNSAMDIAGALWPAAKS